MDRYPLKALRSLLASPAPTRGVVTATNGQRVTLATPAGLQTAIASTTLAIGQTVRLQDGTAYPAARAAERYVL